MQLQHFGTTEANKSSGTVDHCSSYKDTPLDPVSSSKRPVTKQTSSNIKRSTAMGSPVSFVVAEIVMQNIEEQALSTYTKTLPL